MQLNLLLYLHSYSVYMTLHLSLIIGGTYGELSANEYCFILSEAVVKATADFNPKYAHILTCRLPCISYYAVIQ